MEKKYSYEFFYGRGVSADFSDTFSSYAKGLEQRKLPVIFDLEHLSLLLGIKQKYIVRMIYGSQSFYREFKIPKRSGGYRVINSPHESLKYVQRWILENILYKSSIHDNAHGFAKNKSIKTNATPHLGADVLFKIDLKDFFPTIEKGWVINLFRDFGYSSELSFYLASIVCYGDALVQGAPTSPAIANLVFYKADERIRRLCERHLVTYTRYADDLTFSGKYISTSFQHYVKLIINDSGFSLNDFKTRLKINDGSRIVTGLVVTDEILKIPRKYKREIKKEMFFIEKYGYLSHIEREGISGHNYLYKLLGKVSFWRDIEPLNLEVNKYYLKLKELIN